MLKLGEGSRKHESFYDRVPAFVGVREGFTPGVVDANTSWITMCCLFRQRPKGLEKKKKRMHHTVQIHLHMYQKRMTISLFIHFQRSILPPPASTSFLCQAVGRFGMRMVSNLNQQHGKVDTP